MCTVHRHTESEQSGDAAPYLLATRRAVEPIKRRDVVDEKQPPGRRVIENWERALKPRSEHDLASRCAHTVVRRRRG
jgi:hypothetical protein